jgi:hypothetical protein
MRISYFENPNGECMHCCFKSTYKFFSPKNMKILIFGTNLKVQKLIPLVFKEGRRSEWIR